jgi:2-oxoglutarate ferredoxin oxidoreductase subunit alpha
VKAFLVVELNLGQMVEDVQRTLAGRRPVEFFGRTGGVLMTPGEAAEAIERLAAEAMS